MAFRTINFSAGAVRDGAPAEDGVYTTNLSNLFLDDQKQLRPRLSTELVKSFSVAAGTYSNSHYSSLYGWTVIAVTTDTTIQLTIVNATQVVPLAVITTAKPAPRVFFLEVDSNWCKNVNNVIVGGSIILVSGGNILYYLDGSSITTAIAKTFFVGTALVSNATINNPLGMALFQGRLCVGCTGPNITTGEPVTLDTRVLMSSQLAVDNFAPSGATTTGAIDAQILSVSNEVLYGMASTPTALIITTNLGLRSIRAALTTQIAVSSTNITTSIIGFGESIIANPAFFSGFILYATTYNIRAKSLSSLETDFVNTVDMDLPVLTDFNTKITDLTVNLTAQSLSIYLENGEIHSMATQSVYPSKSYQLSLPVTRTHSHPGISYVFLSQATPNILVFYINIAGATVFCIGKSSNQYGYLLEGASTFNWRVTASAGLGGTFTAAFPFAMNSDLDVTAMWVNLSGKWTWFARGPTWPIFVTPIVGVDMSFFNGATLTVQLVVNKKGYNTTPSPYNTPNSCFQSKISLIGLTDNLSYKYDYFVAAPLGPLHFLGDLPTNQQYSGTWTTFAAVAGPQLEIGWRDVACIDILNNQGAIRTVLTSLYHDIGNYLIFYIDNASNIMNVNSDSTEIEFFTNTSLSYAEKRLTALSRNFLPQVNQNKFSRLIGIY